MSAGWSASYPKGTVFEYDGVLYKAQDDEIVGILADAALFEMAGSCSLQTAFEVATKCQRITFAELPIPIGCV